MSTHLASSGPCHTSEDASLVSPGLHPVTTSEDASLISPAVITGNALVSPTVITGTALVSPAVRTGIIPLAPGTTSFLTPVGIFQFPIFSLNISVRVNMFSDIQVVMLKTESDHFFAHRFCCSPSWDHLCIQHLNLNSQILSSNQTCKTPVEEPL